MDCAYVMVAGRSGGSVISQMLLQNQCRSWPDERITPAVLITGQLTTWFANSSCSDSSSRSRTTVPARQMHSDRDTVSIDDSVSHVDGRFAEHSGLRHGNHYIAGLGALARRIA